MAIGPRHQFQSFTCNVRHYGLGLKCLKGLGLGGHGLGLGFRLRCRVSDFGLGFGLGFWAYGSGFKVYAALTLDQQLPLGRLGHWSRNYPMAAQSRLSCHMGSHIGPTIALRAFPTYGPRDPAERT